ncbi:response regulator transcription factor [Fluviicola sp.]|uniref:response regulator n=1 Tax=Fluviicola sp. TaxID=1917219 RepID=UPI0026284C7F|nr:response regulator transcription factor [Fluviicola sp.]
MNELINVCIIEDHPEMREGMLFILHSEPDFRCTSFSNAEGALEAFHRSKPDVVLMDINLPGIDGIECTRKIKELHPEMLVMMCTVLEDSEKIFNALKAGANGYLLKRSAGQILIQSIKDLVNGGAPMSSAIARKVVDSFKEPETKRANPEESSLTKRENEILDLVAKGYANKEIAIKLTVSLHTIRTHIYHIYEKLHVRNRVEALNKTGRHKLR